MNLNRIIKNLKGREVSVSPNLLSRQEIEELPKDDDGKLDMTKLPNETVRSVVLNCLAAYPVSDKREVFYLNAIAGSVLEKDEVEFKEKYQKFLVKVLEESTFRKEKDGEKDVIKGIYFGWVIAQVLDELGLTPEEDAE